MTEAVSPSWGPADMPLEVTSFVGRRSARSQVRELMSASRLVTLTGFGGIGKSRLALRVATDRRRAFPDGVYVVALGGLADPDAVPEHLAATLGLHGRSLQSATIAAVEYLRPRTLLLVLDNCEHVVEAAAVVADTLLRTCAGVHILATSREPLRIHGETVYPVEPLSVPEPVDRALQQYEAVQLFVDRARAIVPDFALTDDNRAAVAAISRKLEGIPLAIELAAARLRVFSPAELLAHLTDRWELLGKGSRTGPYRHSTMAVCIEWSFDLSTPAERLLWAKTSVFVDGFELDAATAVCADADDEEPIQETLSAMVEKSVVTVTRHGVGNRYRMLPPIRHRGRIELTRIGRDGELRRRHQEFYLGLVAQAHEDWFGLRQVDWIWRLRRERGNLAKAFERCALEGDTDAGLDAGAQLLQLGLVEGRFSQGRQWFDRMLAAPPGDPETRARALRTASLWAAMQGDIESATTLLDQGRPRSHGLGEGTKALLTQAAGFVAMFAGDHTQAEQLLSAANRSFAASGNDAELAFDACLLALDHLVVGDLDGALAQHRACLELTETAGETWLGSWSLWIAAMARWMRGETNSATQLLGQSLRLKRRIADPLGIAVLLETLAWVATKTNPVRAATLMGAAQNEWDKIDTSTQVLPGLGEPRCEATTATREALGDPAFELAWSHGRGLDQTTAIALALEEEPPKQGGQNALVPARTPDAVLTRRERQIAALLHTGLTNQEIADALVISRRTAETHVENILTKLGFTNRTQVAAWIGEQLGPSDH